MSSPLKSTLFWGAVFSTLLLASPEKAELPRIPFIPNRGQWHSDVLFLYRTVGMEAWGTHYGLNLTFYQVRGTMDPFWASVPVPEGIETRSKGLQILGHRVLVEFVGANPQPTVEGREPQPGYLNYLKGNDPSKHVRFVPIYGEMVVRQVYSGIDTRYYLDGGRLRFDFWVAAGADPTQIRLRIVGADRVKADNNALIFQTQLGEVRLCELHAYQAGRRIGSRFIQRGEAYQIALDGYDPKLPLVIDPLVYSTYVGGTGMDWGTGIAVNTSGEAFISGWTASTNYDVTPGAFQTSFGGLDYDAFITKLNATGTGLIYSTYIGGSALDEAGNIAIDASGNAYITGTTKSTNFPVTAGAFQTTHGGGFFMYDAFVLKLDPSGASLVYSTYLGASSEEGGVGIAVNSSGEAFVSGWTTSHFFPVTPGAAQTTYGGATFDAFAVRLNATGSGLIYSTFIGGSGDDRGLGIAIDASDNAYVTGWTNSTNFPTSLGAYQTSNQGGYEVFVTKLNPSGTSRVYSTYVGGGGEDRGFGIAVDATGAAYVSGWTTGSYDITAGAYQTVYGGGSYDGFVTKVNSNGTSLQYSTYIGASGDDRAMGIVVDASGRAYITGGTNSPAYPTTTGVFQSALTVPYDAIFTGLDAAGAGLVYSSYLGGGGAPAVNKADIGTTIALDNSDAIYITGGAGLCFPVTVGAFQTAWEGGGASIPLLGTTFYADAFVSKFCLTAGCGIVCGASCDLCSPLAVSGLRLEAVQYGEGQVRLHWEAVGNTSYTAFSLQRLSDARWEEHKLLEPSYSAYITEQKEPFAIYRIVGFTADGRALPSNAVAVHFGSSRSSFTLFPNPVSAQRELMIVTSAGERLGYEVQNTLGVVVAHWSAEEEVSRTKVQLSPGIYWVREISTGQVQKLVVME